MSQLSGWSCNSKILLPEEQVSGSYPPDHGIWKGTGQEPRTSQVAELLVWGFLSQEVEGLPR